MLVIIMIIIMNEWTEGYGMVRPTDWGRTDAPGEVVTPAMVLASRVELKETVEEAADATWRRISTASCL